MGLLDDAIREHLELKRQRGADPADVARLEREALGPVVRGSDLGEPAVEEDLDHLPYEDDLLHGEPGHEPEDDYYDDEPPPAELPAHVGQPTEEFDVEATQVYEVEPTRAVEPRYEVQPAQDVEPQHEVEPAHEAEPQHAAETAHEGEPQHAEEPAHAAERDPEPDPQPRRDGPPQPRPASGPETAEHDVLQDTPEFLQETPEHDRLWFEQAPPQEFDFDK